MKALAAGFTTGVRKAVAAPGELVVRVLFYMVILLVFGALWSAAAAGRDGALGEYTYVSLIWYVVAAEGCVVATKPRMIEEIGDDIGSGAITIEMLRPVTVVHMRLALELGEGIVRLAAALGAGVVAVWIGVGPPPSWPAAALALPAAVLALTVNLLAQHVFASAAFWVADAKATWFLYQKLVFLLGGMLIPLELLPDAMATAARLLPFWATAYIPGRLLSGHTEPLLLLVQVGWLVALTWIAQLAFARGERRLGAVGG